jgi:hypothetical protein
MQKKVEINPEEGVQEGLLEKTRSLKLEWG